MLSETLTEGLDAYAIGEKLRRMRLKKKIGLVELGQHSGLSPAMISKIECGKLYPTLPTLLRLALVFSVGLDHFFVRQDMPVFEITRKSERIRFPDDPNKKPEDISYYFESLDFKATDRKSSSYLVEFESPSGVAAEGPAHAHDRFEFIYLLSGELEIRSGNDRVARLQAGDSIYFDSTVPHSYGRVGGRVCKAILVTTL
jgi:transcriptional regulator with XRE-family HTH domain